MGNMRGKNDKFIIDLNLNCGYTPKMKNVVVNTLDRNPEPFSEQLKSFLCYTVCMSIYAHKRVCYYG